MERFENTTIYLNPVIGMDVKVMKVMKNNKRDTVVYFFEEEEAAHVNKKVSHILEFNPRNILTILC